MKRVALITGASSGFGLLTAIELARQEFDVIATMRNLEKSSVFATLTKEQQVLERIHPLYLDVTKQESIDTLREKVESIDRIDLLINNAGFAIGGFAEEIEMEAYRRQFDTNVFGVMAVTQVIVQKMRQQGFGKIINLSSVSGKIGFPGLSPYVSSKFALEGYSESLRLELQPFGVQVALVEPGSFATNIWSSGMEVATRSLNDQSPYHIYLRAISSQLESGKKNHGDPNEVAKLIGQLAKKKEFKKLRYPIGKGLKAMIVLKQTLSWYTWERTVLRKLFKNNKV